MVVRTSNTLIAPELPTSLLLSLFNTSMVVCPALFFSLLLNSCIDRVRSSTLTNVRQECHLQEFCTLHLLHKLLVLLLLRCDIKAIRCTTPHGNDVHTIWHRSKIATAVGTSWRPVRIPTESNRTTIVNGLLLISSQIGIILLAFSIVHRIISTDMIVRFVLYLCHLATSTEKDSCTEQYQRTDIFKVFHIQNA